MASQVQPISTPAAPPAQPSVLVSRLPWLAAMRPEHWIKNILLFVAIPFTAQVTNPQAWALCGIGFVAFCLLASSVYLVNDIRDRAADAAHPTKRHRPIASGRLRVPTAGAEAALLLAGGLACAATLGKVFLLAAWSYLALNALYTFWLKHHPIIDVVVLSLGFVVRAMASAVALAVPSSAYLVLCTFMLCLFIALAKRRSEVGQIGDDETQALRTRRVNVFYTPTRTEHMLAVSAGLSIVTYSLYCIAPATVENLHSHHLIWTVPLVVYGMFRYYCLSGEAGQEDPVKVVLRDKVLWLVGLLWLAMVLGVVAVGTVPELAPLRNLLK